MTDQEIIIKEYLLNGQKIEDLHKDILLKLKLIERYVIRNQEIEKLIAEANGGK